MSKKSFIYLILKIAPQKTPFTLSLITLFRCHLSSHITLVNSAVWFVFTNLTMLLPMTLVTSYKRLMCHFINYVLQFHFHTVVYCNTMFVSERFHLDSWIQNLFKSATHLSYFYFLKRFVFMKLPIISFFSFCSVQSTRL